MTRGIAMQGEPAQSQGNPQGQQQPPQQEQLATGLGWLLKPAAAGEIGVYISGVQGAKEFTPEMLQSLEELMQRLQQENQGVVSARKCGALGICGGNHQTCPFLSECTNNTVDCPQLTKCTANT
jgi:hypothetical protein